MLFIKINGSDFNFSHIGTIEADPDKLTITYTFSGGGKVVEKFDTFEELVSRLQSISEL